MTDPVLSEVQKLTKRLGKRGFHIEEVVKTERTYVERLQTIADHFITPLREQKILSENEIQTQFTNWDIILDLHIDFLNQLEDQLDPSNPNSLPLGRLFTSFAPALTAADYGKYFIKYEDARNARAGWLTSQLPKGRRFESFLTETQDETGLLLENVLSEPILRIPRYRILLEQIIKYTDDPVALGELNEGLAMIRDVAEQCNETVKIKQKRDKLFALINRMDFRGRINLLEPKPEDVCDDDEDGDDNHDRDTPDVVKQKTKEDSNEKVDEDTDNNSTFSAIENTVSNITSASNATIPDTIQEDEPSDQFNRNTDISEALSVDNSVSSTPTNRRQSKRMSVRRTSTTISDREAYPNTELVIDDLTSQTYAGWFLKEGTLRKHTRKGVAVSYVFWLFENSLMYGETTALGYMLFHRELDLRGEMRIVIPYKKGVEPPENVLTHTRLAKIDNAVDVTFEIHSPRKSFNVVCESLKERDEWVTAIMDAINKHRGLVVAKHGLVAAMWTPDNLVDACELCQKPFTMITRRRHHCRSCGKVACYDCCSSFCNMPHIKKDKKVRVCNDCHKDRVGVDNANTDDSTIKTRNNKTRGSIGFMSNIFNISNSSSSNVESPTLNPNKK